MKIFVYFIILVVAAAIIAGFFIAGSPTSERARRFDEQRVNNLMQIQNEVIFYWQNKNKLPGNLSELNDSTRGVAIPKDPKTGAAYEYQVDGALKFELCATFETLNSNSEIKTEATPYHGPENWFHNAGRQCFTRTIDPNFFKIKQSSAPPYQ